MDSAYSRQISLFGSLRIQEGEEVYFLSGEKAQSLLAFLVLHPTPQGREQLANLLFPDAPFDRVRRNFSDSLYRVQKVLGNDWLLAESKTVSLCKDKPLWVDVWEFDRLAASTNPADIEMAIALYKGDLLPTCYDDWILSERELRRNQFLIALENLATHLETSNQLQQALLTTRRLIQTEPLHEPGHRTYLRLLGRLRRYSEAEIHFENLRQLFQEELDAQPSADTFQIVKALRQERSLSSNSAVPQEQMPFVGRTLERTRLLDSIEATLRGVGSIIAIEGKPGIGKSRLLREITAGARWRGATVLRGIASETPEATPFAPLIEALAPFLNSPQGTQLKTLLPNEVLSTLAPLYPSWGTDAVVQETLKEQAVYPFKYALQALSEALVSLTPLVMIFDDVQWASPALWDCLEVFSKSIIDHKGLLLLSYRRAEIEQTIGWKTLQAWERAGLIHIFALQPLTIEEVTQLFRDKSELDPAFIHALTNGHPFLLREWYLGNGQSQPDPEYAVLQRLATVSSITRKGLESAAVLGESVPFSFWSRMVDMPSLLLAQLSEELVEQNWLYPSKIGFTFAHDLIRTAIYHAIPQDHLSTLHTQAARVYQLLDPENARSIAFHLDRAGLRQEAAAAYRKAGEQDLSRFAYHEAQKAFNQALTLIPPTQTIERLELLLSLAWTFNVLGERAQQLEILKEVLAGAKKLKQKPLQLKALLAYGQAYYQMHEIVKSESYLQAALDMARKLHDYASQAEAYLSFGACKMVLRQTETSVEYYKKALRLSRKHGFSSKEARTLRGLGIAMRDLGSPKEAIKWLDQAVKVHRQIGDHFSVAVTQSSLVMAYYDLGAWDHLIETAEEVLPKVEAYGYRYNVAFIQHLQGLASYNLGKYAEARQQFIEARKNFEATKSVTTLTDGALGLVAEAEGNPEEALRLYHQALNTINQEAEIRETPVIQRDLGALLWKLEQPKEAIPYLESANRTWAEQGDALGCCKCETYLGLSWLTLGERTRAQAFAEKGWATFQAGIPSGEQLQDWLWALYRLLLSMEQIDRAKIVLEGAYHELQRQAGEIRDPELRRSFFAAVPLNADIVEAYNLQANISRKIFISLARREAPLGRLLRSEEYIAVNWTVYAPEDEAFRDKTAQRHYRLKRLFREAEAYGVTPTDDDLSNALGVSRRTILRDMQTLSNELPHLPTRKRK